MNSFQKSKHLLFMLPLSFFLTACNDSNSDTTSHQELELGILHINDHHSHLDPEKMKFKVDVGQGEEEITVSRGGFARVAALIKQLEMEKKNVIKIHSGDAVTGDLYFNLTDGKADAGVMNAVCFDTFTLGNHEFDAKDEGLNKFIGLLDQSQCKEKIKILSANVNFGPSSVLYKNQRIQKSAIIEKNGQKIGLIGLTIAQKTKNASQPNFDTTFSEEISTAQQEINQLKAQGIKRIILQTHTGYELDKKLATELTDVDVIIGGDSHTLLGPQQLIKYGMTPTADYPSFFKNKDGDNVCVAQAWQYSYVVGELNVKFDQEGRLKSCEGIPHILIGDDFQRAANSTLPLTAEEQQRIIQKLDQDKIPFKVVQPDVQVSQIIQPYQIQKQQFAQTVVANALENLCLRRVPGVIRDVNRSTLGDICNQNTHVNEHGGDVQQIVAEAFLQQGKVFFDADISFQNAGGTRIDIPQGPITVGMIYQVLPFQNTLVQLNMTGAEIKATLEDAVDAVVNLKNTGSYPYTGGLRWHIDLNQGKGQRISEIEVRTKDGQYKALNNDQIYKVITIDFLANGSDFYSTMKSITGSRRIDVGLDYAEAFLKYIETMPVVGNQKQIGPLNTALYSTQRFVDKSN